MKSFLPTSPPLSGSTLKWLALAFMTLDHIGVVFFSWLPFALYLALRMLGRISFPLFAFCVAEGYTYTKSRKVYGLRMAFFGLAIQAFCFLFTESLSLNIFITLSLSVFFMWLWDMLCKDKRGLLAFIPSLAIALVLCSVKSDFYGFSVSYGIFGILLPLFAYAGKDKEQKLLLFAFGSLLLCLSLTLAPLGALQWFCLLALPLLCLYNGKAGKGRLKYFFYLYYPLHLALLWGIRMLLL